jgi:indolepyruvate ferredoxin oxidoreductase
MAHVFRLLARLRWLRGTAFDPFGHTAERRMERRLVADYETIVRELASVLDPGNHALAVEIASLPAQIRGFGHIKQRNAEKAKAREAELLDMLRGKAATVTAA